MMIKSKLVALAILGCIVSAPFLYYKISLRPVGKGEVKVIVIKEGASLSQISKELKKERLVRSETAFKIHVTLSGLSKKLQAGSFSLSPASSAAQISQSLTVGALDTWVTIPEGLRVEEIAKRLNEKLGIPEKEFVSSAQEGYMFPDTYLLPKKTTSQEVVKIMRVNFERRFSSLRSKISPKLTEKQLVILASLVEREVKFSEDRPKVAGILIRRLNLGMPLEVDATVQYALGYSQEEKTWWRKNLTQKDLKNSSPYNTREFAGLPPAPIANPGLSSLEAVISPVQADYLYYLSDEKGKIYYAKTLDEHIQNINSYL